LLKAVSSFELLPFEARKDTAHIFNNMMRKDLQKFSRYVFDNYAIVERLINGYSNADTALNCGSMLRECVRYDEIARAILQSPLLWLFFDVFVHLRNFEVAADSFSTLKALLTTPRNQAVSGEFLDSKYEEIMEHYEVCRLMSFHSVVFAITDACILSQKLLQSENFVTRWMSLKLLGEILLDRRNRSVMVRYVSSVENLKSIMNLLRDRASNIQFE
jgi:calcium binding protein 39